MKELYQLNYLVKNNENIMLKEENKDLIEKLKKAKNYCIEVKENYEDRLNAISIENEKMKSTIEVYEKNFKKIPKFILKIFCGKN